ncbi:hypothetical protein HD_0809 [[Haemophilus] ducreyi 35000HP]|uniref:Uncharacterized protein n=1 Tax=Haemophilus ducreyi (strain 35000HP / ATCC 700724) TaxID=233412 RepID=Q7VMZ3_HAEDU|nr:hypothetical protein HD_0809 [[Haemophilus] ducreyi 35000HP]
MQAKKGLIVDVCFSVLNSNNVLIAANFYGKIAVYVEES